jgi:hypothetical protein
VDSYWNLVRQLLWLLCLPFTTLCSVHKTKYQYFIQSQFVTHIMLLV